MLTRTLRQGQIAARPMARSFTSRTSSSQGWGQARKLGAGALAIGGGATLAYNLREAKCDDSFSGTVKLVGGLVAAGAVATAAYTMLGGNASTVWQDVRDDLKKSVLSEEDDDNAHGPLFVRLSWHASGTYHKDKKNGGSDGAYMRFAPESQWGANAGLHLARAKLEPIYQKYKDQGVTHADLWNFTAAVAIEEMSGGDVKIPFRPGRSDAPSSHNGAVEDGRLPDATQGPSHLRDIFYKMGFNDQDIVILSGAHTLGECHADRSGFVGPWTHAKLSFSNMYYTTLLDETWVVKPGSNPMQYMDKASGELMMLPTDTCLLTDEKFAPWVEVYAADEQRFFKDFSKTFVKLQELGCKNLKGVVHTK